MLKIEIYNQSHQKDWDNFIGTSRNGTFMQQRTFLNYHPPGRFVDCSLMVYNSHGNLIAVIPAAQKMEGQKKVFSSYPGASHGGIIVDQKFGTYEAMALVPLLTEYCKSNDFNAIQIKMVPRIYHFWPSDEIDFALRYYGFSISTNELATALPIKELANASDHLIESTQRNIRKAQRLGVTIEESNDLATYWGILTDNLKQKHHAQPTHTLAEITDLTNRYPQSIKLSASFLQGEMVSGVVIFLLNSRVINCFYIASNNKYQTLRSLELLFYKLISWGMEKGYDYLDWGISTENKGLMINQGLFEFKEKFGGRGILRESYYLDLSDD
ncbi:GNAT family N-acetyltransferase [Sporomusa malonica]|uniref:Acetyltransferase (GNAT) domain-containing protein n=1 Tax=Sporomusa malonica TaxID=112901 RepID=A0A1W2EGB0_9FIRM|nr:GNAT family N-acetyltransferase [Sporomusa malonica]SMD08743.1 Acetyltransferase (GNAT) domain-containing protein [Sporomusa malonica]